MIEISRKWLRTDEVNLLGEAKILCKVTRIIPSGQPITVSALFNDVIEITMKGTAITPVDEENYQKAVAQLSGTIMGPAMKVIPIGIYK